MNKKISDKQLLEYIKSKKWGNFYNREMDLLIHSMQVKGLREMQRKAPRKISTEDIVVNYGNDKQLKMFSLTTSFTPEIIQFYLDNPYIISEYIEKSYVSLKRSKETITKIESVMLIGDIDKLIFLTKELLAEFLEVSYWKTYITVLSMRICKKEQLCEKVKEVLQEIQSWKNDENFYGFESEILIEIAHLLSVRRNLGVHGWEISKYLHVDEFMDFLDEKIAHKEVRNIIEGRRRIGYVALNLEHCDYENVLLCNSTPEAKGIIKHVDGIFEKENKINIKENIIYGTSVVKGEKIISGECAVIRSYQELNDKINLDGKILVTIMSTPKYLLYIKKVKAIITDTGGMMCHAAITAREYNIPCIVGTNVGTTFLKTGDRVEMDLGRGMVRKVS